MSDTHANCARCTMTCDEDDMFEVKARIRRADTEQVLAEGETELLCESCVRALLQEQAAAGGTITADFDYEDPPAAAGEGAPA